MHPVVSTHEQTIPHAIVRSPSTLCQCVEAPLLTHPTTAWTLGRFYVSIALRDTSKWIALFGFVILVSMAALEYDTNDPWVCHVVLPRFTPPFWPLGRQVASPSWRPPSRKAVISWKSSREDHLNKDTRMDTFTTVRQLDYRRDALLVEKAVALTGVLTYKGAYEAVKHGRVTSNGVPLKIGDMVTRQQRLEVDGQCLPERQELAYYVLNKPRQVG
mmetsp:Transcript_150566/g.263136  ORF Transcript_150566/g.263136 Transcript_150566/m.263136 type:complete len:216 (-) Transcript_150566:350-997(-)